MSLAQLRPLDFGEILDRAFALYRHHFITLFLTALIPYLPLALFYAIFMGTMDLGSPEELESTFNIAALLTAPYSIFAALLVWGALIHESSEAITGNEVSRKVGYRRALKRFWPLLGAGFLSILLIGFGFVLLIVPGILAAIMLFCVWQVVMVEDRGPVEALGRSRALASGAWGRIFGILLVSFVIISIPSMLVGMLSAGGMLAALWGGGTVDSGAVVGWTMTAGQILGMLVSAATYPFLAAATTVLYYDRRVRVEALDLEMAAEGLATAH